jgi:hypothetical protein
MKPLTAVALYRPGLLSEKTVRSLIESGLVETVLVVSGEEGRPSTEGCDLLIAPESWSRETVSLVLDRLRTDYVLWFPGYESVAVDRAGLERIVWTAREEAAGLLYSDFYDCLNNQISVHPVNDYQIGSARDDFEFGPMMVFSVSALRNTIQKHGMMAGLRFGGLYHLRLSTSMDHPFYHVREPLYSVLHGTASTGREGIFSYVDPRNRVFQKEMETIFTQYLKKIDAYRDPSCLGLLTGGAEEAESYPVEASVVIPVRNRAGTVADAVASALSQRTDFPFTILAVDNHSTDGTTSILSDMAGRDKRLQHIIPARHDLGIGGCWNKALFHKACGRFAVQLDSDDLYSNPQTLQKMVDALRQGKYAMVIGSYTLVDPQLREIPPGLIDHREWTDENSHNNALRVNGLGAPRGFHTGIMRAFQFPNVSYGEDYAAGLRVCREFRVRRIYESVYLCRRWSGNTDAAPTIEETNRNNAFKDRLRSEEILARQKLNK